MRRLAAAALAASLAACAAPPSPERGPVFFTEPSAQLDQPARAAVARAADLARARPDARAAVAGFADPDGSPRANMDMSRRRAQSVADALAANGVAPARLRRVARGEVAPPLSSQASRRVDIPLGD